MRFSMFVPNTNKANKVNVKCKAKKYQQYDPTSPEEYQRSSTVVVLPCAWVTVWEEENRTFSILCMVTWFMDTNHFHV